MNFKEVRSHWPGKDGGRGERDYIAQSIETFFTLQLLINLIVVCFTIWLVNYTNTAGSIKKKNTLISDNSKGVYYKGVIKASHCVHSLRVNTSL